MCKYRYIQVYGSKTGTQKPYCQRKHAMPFDGNFFYWTLFRFLSPSTDQRRILYFMSFCVYTGGLVFYTTAAGLRQTTCLLVRWRTSYWCEFFGLFFESYFWMWWRFCQFMKFMKLNDFATRFSSSKFNELSFDLTILATHGHSTLASRNHQAIAHIVSLYWESERESERRPLKPLKNTKNHF